MDRFTDLLNDTEKITTRFDAAAILLFCLYDYNKYRHIAAQRESLREFFSDQDKALPVEIEVFAKQDAWGELLLKSLQVIRAVIFIDKQDEASRQLRLQVRELVEALKLPLTTESMLTLLIDSVFVEKIIN